MKRILILLWTVCLFWGCQDDENFFGASMSGEDISFKPVAGGAVMHYQLPSDSDVLAIRVRYQDAYGQNVLRTGSYACDSVLLTGFNEAQQGIKASVTLCDRAGNESTPIDVSFDTKDSGPILFFNELKINPAWEGFQLSYDISEQAEGMAHVFYVGTNPETQKLDTLPLTSFMFREGSDTLSFKLQQQVDKITVVVRTEDINKGHIVKQMVYPDVKSYNIELLPATEYTFSDPEELSIEDETVKLSKDYLFDGDTKGLIPLGLDVNECGTYLAGPNAFGKPLFIIDLKETRQLAEIRLYTVIDINRYFYGIFGGYYENKLPCDAKLYATNTIEDDNSWVEIFHFQQDWALDGALRWCEKVPSIMYTAGGKGLKTPAEVEAATPYYMSLQFSVDAIPYRYLKIVVENTFLRLGGGTSTPNAEQYVTFHEFEVWTKKE